MKVLFICGSIGLGLSGVGDYARRLSEELARQGHEATLVGLCESDDHDNALVAGTIESCSSVPLPRVLRLRANTSWKRRTIELSEFLSRVRPDVISLQYVPYAFQARGLPFRLARRLRGITPHGSRWQIMFHEICVGLGDSCSWKHRVIGSIQKRIAAGLVRTLRPIAVHSHAVPYLDILRNLGLNAKPLPLFSNVPAITKQVIPDQLPVLRDKQSYVDFAFFGTVHPDWNVNRVVELLKQIGKSRELSPRIIAIGRGGRFSATTWETFRNAGVDVIETGLIDDKSVSAYLSNCDLGLSGYPPDLIQKSGAAAAMFECGLSILVPRAPIWGNRYMAELRSACPWMIIPEFSLQPVNALPCRTQLPLVAEKFLADIAPK